MLIDSFILQAIHLENEFLSQLKFIMQGDQQEQRHIKALLCQISPFLKDKKKTIDRIKVSLQMYSSKDKLDILIFPEMSFLGYNFDSFQDALPFAVAQNQGIDFDFAKEIATRLNVYVAFGYMEKAEQIQGTKLYNSAAIIDRSGNQICNYRKNNLYYNDKKWAIAGEKFVTIDLVTVEKKTIKCGVGICADIMPKSFTSSQWELADYLVKNQCEALLFLTNWVDSEKDDITNSDIAATYNYWIHRLQPIVLTKKTFLFLAADRVGTEFDVFAKKNTTFYGSSCAIMLNPSKILKNLDIKNEGYLLIDTYLP